LEVRANEGQAAAIESARTDTVRRAVADIQNIAAEIESEQETLLATRRQLVDVAYRSAIRGRVGSGILSAALIIIVVILAFGHARFRVRRELELVRSERRARDAATGERRARSEAERANALKDEFLAVLSHELRTPLNAVLGWAQILDTAEIPDPAMRRAISAIRRNAEAQQRLVEDLLDVSRIVSGKFALQSRAFELRSSISAAVDAIRPAAQAKGVEVSVALNGPALTNGDPDRIQQVAANLLSNAVKFTPEGGRVNVTLTSDRGQAELVVHDTGCGIPPDLKPFVFERFRTGDGSTTREHGGLGLGLAIAKHIVDAHGGSIEARSEGAGQGSTFRVRLPAA
jgi:signal transduction histidine kinase